MTRERRTLSSVAVVALFVAGCGVLAWTWTGVRTTSANFGDQEVFDRNHLGAGTVDIALGARTVNFDVVDMAAGDVRDGRLDVANLGTLPLRYSITATSDTSALADVLQLAVWIAADACATRPPAGVDWVRPGELADAGVAPPASPRALAPGESELLCMRGRLPLSAPTSVQGQRLALNFVISAEHDVETSS